ncbi:uncharacterized protein A1O9_06983 [Exophiala aquamarina CBS 119918]|uniref:Uncharacterized protein n=1 Tax=Exophiala aquamarina CBS 119918 TaxID=1182545 RepID=A0A072PC01_9EURO|nr:uncharacterized protein A1O9_06983 [Exophiala aquamarina CBS 119918]KEF56793.1 hypothetical protein A1O9_06983 [Exophiala aquamarina CBS 119918]
MSLRTLRQRLCTATFLTITFPFWFPPYHQHALNRGVQPPLHPSRHEPSPREIAANSTLGFEKILAVPLKPSWRTRGLIAAAELTGLSIEVPEQPYNTDDLIRAFEGIDNTHLQQGIHLRHGSARAWLAHLDVMKYIVASGISSAFIIEDNIDWDTDIKTSLKLVSGTVRKFMQTPIASASPSGYGWDVV